MKKILSLFLLIAAVATLSGCATSGEKTETRLRPPIAFNPTFLKYQALDGQKVMTVAVDLSGNWAFGFDHGRETLEEAGENAAIKCDMAREKHKVYAKAMLFAVNDEIVYYKNQLK